MVFGMCKCHFENKEARKNHEAIQKKRIERMNLQIPPFWLYLRINASEVEGVKYFDFLSINKHAR
jgi:hypothetical protein